MPYLKKEPKERRGIGTLNEPYGSKEVFGEQQNFIGIGRHHR